MAEMGSSLEIRVYQALLHLGWRRESIAIQTPILGGRQQRGGQVVDFVVYAPQPVPIYANGEYWHRDPEREAQAQADAREVFGVEPVVIWGEEAATDDMARAVVLARVGRGV